MNSSNPRWFEEVPLVVEGHGEPINLLFITDRHDWHTKLDEHYTTRGWNRGINRLLLEPNRVLLSVDTISDAQNNDMAFAKYNDYIIINTGYTIALDHPMTKKKLALPFVVRVPFARHHFRIWKNDVIDGKQVLYGSGTYDHGIRVGERLFTKRGDAKTVLTNLVKREVENAYFLGVHDGVLLLSRSLQLKIGHHVKSFDTPKVVEPLQRKIPVKRVKEMFLNPTGKEIRWNGIAFVYD